MEQNDLNYSGQYLDDKYFKIKIATGGDIYNAAENAVAGEMFLVTGAQPALYAAKSTSAFNEGIVDHEIYKVKDLNDTVKIKDGLEHRNPGPGFSGCRMIELAVVQTGIKSLLIKQVFMLSLFNDIPVVHNQN